MVPSMFEGGGMRAHVFPLEPKDGACTVVFDVTPSRKPPADPRLLGVHIDYFNYVPTQ